MRRCGSYWAVAQTHPQAERWADANLTRQGYTTFLPLCRVKRRDRAVPTLWHTVTTPLFTSYLFVTISQHWTPIRHTLGVRRLLLDGDGNPGMVPEAALSALRGVQDLAAPGNDGLEAGSACSVVCGPLEGHEAVVTEVHGSHATIGLIMFGHLRQVSVPLACLIAR